jgi:uncharacterized protein YdhG (YjbR/CyaY superfamily)
MQSRSPEVDAYIARAADFARPILKKIRSLFHKACPEIQDYVEWITESRQDETRVRRLATAIEWMAAGKPRNWKYMKKW